MGRLLKVPSVRQRHIARVREMATTWLDWKRLGPLTGQFQSLIADEVKADTRKLSSNDAFLKGLNEDTGQEGFRGRESMMSIKSFAEQRRAHLLNHPDLRKPGE